jgi:addiction module HigA family antidote
MSTTKNVKTEHAGAKNGGGFRGRRVVAKEVSSKLRRERGKAETRLAPVENRMRPIHPGEILSKDYLVPMAISMSAFAKTLDVPVSWVIGVVDGTRSVTASMALKLALALGTSFELWVNLQRAYDCKVAEPGQ